MFLVGIRKVPEGGFCPICKLPIVENKICLIGEHYLPKDFKKNPAESFEEEQKRAFGNTIECCLLCAHSRFINDLPN